MCAVRHACLLSNVRPSQKSHNICYESLLCHGLTRSRWLQTEWAFDRDWDRNHKTGDLTPAKIQFPFDSFMDAYGRTKVKRAVSVEELAEGERSQSSSLPVPWKRHAFRRCNCRM